MVEVPFFIPYLLDQFIPARGLLDFLGGDHRFLAS
jgi:hypothetical protein